MSAECTNLGTCDKYFVNTNFCELLTSHEYSKNLSHAKVSTSMVQFNRRAATYLLISANYTMANKE